MGITVDRIIAQNPDTLRQSIFVPSWEALEGLKQPHDQKYDVHRKTSTVPVRLHGDIIPVECIRYQPEVEPIKTMLFVPGAGHPAKMYEPLAKWLASQGVAVQLYSAPGTGLTPMPKFFEFLGIRGLARVGAAVLQDMPEREVVIGAHSIGAITSRLITALNKDKQILGMAYISGMGDEGSGPSFARLYQHSPASFFRTFTMSLLGVYQSPELANHFLFNGKVTTNAFLDPIGTLPYRSSFDILVPNRPRSSNTPAAQIKSIAFIPEKDQTILPTEQTAFADQIKATKVNLTGSPHDPFLTSSLPELSAGLISWIKSL